MSVSKINKLDLNKIIIGKRDIIGNKISHFTVKYDVRLDDIVIQTPKIIFQGTPNKSNNFYNQTLCFYNYDCCEETRDFIDKCIELEKLVYDKVKQRVAPVDIPTKIPTIPLPNPPNISVQQVKKESEVKTIEIKGKKPKLVKKKKTSINDCKEEKVESVVESAPESISPENTFQSSIQFNHTKTKAYMFVTIKPDILSVFNMNREKKSIDYIQSQSSGYCILYLHSLWNHDMKWGMNWTCLQTKVYLPYPILDEYMIIDPDEDYPKNHYREQKYKPVSSEIPNVLSIHSSSAETSMTNSNVSGIIDENHPIYGKFIKMKRVGLPDPVINIKCQQEGLNWNSIQEMMKGEKKPEDNHNVGITLAPPPPSMGFPPNPFASAINGAGRGRPMFSADMFANAKLKKVDTDEVERQNKLAKSEKADKLKELNKGFQPPSVDDIQNMLSRLRSRSSIVIKTEETES